MQTAILVKGDTSREAIKRQRRKNGFSSIPEEDEVGGADSGEGGRGDGENVCACLRKFARLLQYLFKPDTHGYLPRVEEGRAFDFSKLREDLPRFVEVDELTGVEGVAERFWTGLAKGDDVDNDI